MSTTTPATFPVAPTTGSASGGTAPTGGGSSSSGGTGPHISQPSVYVVQDGHAPASVLVFPLDNLASGPTAEIPGTNVSVDAEGNIYVFTGQSIDEYSAASPTGPPLRTLPVGQGAKIPAVQDVMASAAGEIILSDGKGIAIFSKTATGNVDPDRYILGVTQAGPAPSRAIIPGLITVDRSGNLFVQDQVDSSIAVFGPADTGTVVPSRTIRALNPTSQRQFAYIAGMATDTNGNLYVLCLCGTDQYPNVFGVFEFGPGANGGDAPFRYVSNPLMYPYFYNDGIAVGSDGTIYVSAGYSSGHPALFVLPPGASGSADVGIHLDSSQWIDAPNSRIAVNY